MRKILLVCMSFLVFLSIGGVGVSASDVQTKGEVIFSDTKKHWASEKIDTAVEKGYVAGYPNGTFRPDAEVSRAEFMKMVVSALNYEVGPAQTGSPWYAAYAEAASKEGLYLSTDFTNWTAHMTRNEMARMSVRAIGQSAEEETKWMYLAALAGLISGVDKAGTLAEDRAMTRAQAVTIIERILNLRNGGTEKVDKYALGNAEILWHKTNIFTVMPEYFEQAMPDEDRKTDFNYKNMKSTTRSKSASCEVTKIVAIDLTDKNDPNRKLLSKDHRWFVDFRNYYDFEDVNGYALVSVSEITFNGKGHSDDYYTCFVRVSDQKLVTSDNALQDYKNPQLIYQIASLNNMSGVERPENAVNGKAIHIKGYLFPKPAPHVVSETYMFYIGQGIHTDVIERLYISRIKE